MGFISTMAVYMHSWVEDLRQRSKGITIHSQSVEPGMFFVALSDNPNHIEEAITRGAVGVLLDANSTVLCPSKIPSHRLPNLKNALPEYLRLLYPEAKQMPLWAVTGTSGKTSIAWLLQQVLTRLAVPAGYIGTLGVHWPEYKESSMLTTPDMVTLYRLCQQAYQANLKVLCIEASSHALAQSRLADLSVDTAIFHNLSHEHLDYHISMQAYALAKRRLLSRTEVRYALLNADDSYADFMREAINPQSMSISYGIFTPADVVATEVHFAQGRIRAQIHSPWGIETLDVPGFSESTVYNALAVITAACVHDIPLAQVCEVLALCPMPPGRMSLYVRPQSPLVVVDYAHKPEALSLLLRSVRRLLTPSGRVWCVFGCGGNRDTAKRPIMGQIAFELADRLVVTSDNPRDEEAQQIAEEICSGMPYRPENLIIELNRSLAIDVAIEQASPNDVVVIAGKGHEGVQIIRGQQYAFSDSGYLEGLGYAPKSHL